MAKVCSGDRKRACGATTRPDRWFGDMIEHCLAHAEEAHAAGKPIVGIMCEYAPRELIMAAGAVPVCLCGGDADMIPAAETRLPGNLCPLVKSTYGYLVEKANPFLEMADLIVAETTCDGKKKMYELLGEEKQTYILELPQKAADKDAFAHWRRELTKLRGFLEARYGRKITDGRLRRAINAMNRERRLRRALGEMMKSEAPPFTGLELLQLKSSISCMDEDLAMYEAAVKHYAERPRRGLSRRVRVLLTGAPTVHGAEKLVEILEKSGGLVVAMENCTGLKPILDDVRADGEPLEALARKYWALPCSVKTPNKERLDLLRRLAAEYRAECVVELVWQACLTYDVESAHVRRLAAEKMGLPYLRIETDYSPSDAARIAVRVEALFETARGARPERGKRGRAGKAR